MSFNYSTSVFIGKTIHGASMPVFFDTHAQINNGMPPGILITGAPGSGKTFLALNITAISGILGKTTIVLDPKGDFLALLNLKEEIGNINFWNLNSPKEKGTLDPFYMADDPGDRLDLVMTVIDMFIGGLSNSLQTILSPIVKDVLESDVPSLMKVIDMLMSDEREEARGLGTQLDLIRNLPFAKLCFAPGNRRRKNVRFDSGVTIITMIGLTLKTGDDGGSDSANRKLRLTSTIFYLITDFIRRIMESSNDYPQKTLVIDEAWAVISSPAGAACIKEVAKLGRSKNLNIVLITQNNEEVEALNIDNTIKTRFAFRTTMKEAKGIIKGMQLPEEEGFEQILLGLERGQCLMKDWRDRYSTMEVIGSNDDWNEAFKNNPLDKLRRDNKKAAT